MGSSSSRTRQTIENNTINKNTMNTLNSTIMNTGVETMINNANSCSNSVDVSNTCDFSGMNTGGGDLNFTADQSNTVRVNFNCINAAQTSADMATSMMASLVSEMKTLNGTEAAANLNSASQSSNTTSFASMPGGGSSSSSDSNVTNNVTNETISNVENIFEQNLNNNFSAETVNECIGRTSVSNYAGATGMDTEGGTANIECIQTNDVEVVSECKQLAEAITTTTQEVAQELGLTVSTESTTGTTTEATNKATSENVATGPIQEIGDAITDIAGALGLAFLGPILGPSLSLCCVLIIIGCLFFIITQIMGSVGESGYTMDSMGSMGSFGSSLNSMGSSYMPLNTTEMVGGTYELSDLFTSSIVG